MYRIILLFILFFTGCASNNIVTDLSIPEPGNLNGFSSIDEVKQKYFVEDAYEAIKDIPTILGNTWFGKPFVSGVNFWSSFASTIMFNGWGPKVIVSSKRLYSNSGLDTIIHEYVHHLDALDRQGRGEFIDHDEFRTALARMLEDDKYKKRVQEVMNSADSFITNIFGIGPLAEEIAYMADDLVINDGPDYMWHVFRNMLRNPFKSEK